MTRSFQPADFKLKFVRKISSGL